MIVQPAMAAPDITIFYYNSDLVKNNPKHKITLQEVLMLVDQSKNQDPGSAKRPMAIQQVSSINFFSGGQGFSAVFYGESKVPRDLTALVPAGLIHAVPAERPNRIFVSFGEKVESAGNAEVLRKFLTEDEGEYVLFVDPIRHEAHKQVIFDVRAKEFLPLDKFAEAITTNNLRFKAEALKIYLSIAPSRFQFGVLKYCGNLLGFK